MRSQKIHRYRSLFEKAEGRKLFVVYKRKTKDYDGKPITNNWTLYGKVVKVNKNSIKFITSGEDEYDKDKQIITIGYRTIIDCYFMSSYFRIKYKLYYK